MTRRCQRSSWLFRSHRWGVLLGLALVTVSALSLTACGGEADADSPPDIAYGEDVCDRCHMIISDERHSAGVTTEDNDKLVFDDTGEMIAYIQEEGLTTKRIWVHDWQTGEWIDGAKAFFVASMTTETPMGTGMLAFEARADADAFADENDAMVMDWTTTLAEWKLPMKMH